LLLHAGFDPTHNHFPLEMGRIDNYVEDVEGEEIGRNVESGSPVPQWDVEQETTGGSAVIIKPKK